MTFELSFSHTPSYRCIRRMLHQSPHCPICKAGLPPQNPIHPNFSCKWLHLLVACFMFCFCSVNDLVTKYKLEKADSAKRRCSSLESQRLLDAVSAAGWRWLAIWRCSFDNYLTCLCVADLPKVLEIVQDKLRRKEEVECPLLTYSSYGLYQHSGS